MCKHLKQQQRGELTQQTSNHLKDCHQCDEWQLRCVWERERIRRKRKSTDEGKKTSVFLYMRSTLRSDRKSGSLSFHTHHPPIIESFEWRTSSLTTVTTVHTVVVSLQPPHPLTLSCSFPPCLPQSQHVLVTCLLFVFSMFVFYCCCPSFTCVSVSPCLKSWARSVRVWVCALQITNLLLIIWYLLD